MDSNILYDLEKGEPVLFRPISEVKKITGEFIYPTTVKTFYVKDIIKIKDKEQEKIHAIVFVDPKNKMKRYWIFNDDFRNFNICKFHDIGLYNDLEFEITKLNSLINLKKNKNIIKKIKDYFEEMTSVY